MKNSKIKVFIKAIIIPVIVGGVVGLIISKSIDYNTLQKPPLSPPSILFPIVWTLLYVLMGISYGILEINKLVDRKINVIYYLQLSVNALWSIIWIILLDILVIIMIKKFYDKNKTAGLLQVPYIIWTLFATYLNFGVYLLNRGTFM